MDTSNASDLLSFLACCIGFGFFVGIYREKRFEKDLVFVFLMRLFVIVPRESWPSGVGLAWCRTGVRENVAMPLKQA